MPTHVFKVATNPTFQNLGSSQGAKDANAQRQPASTEPVLHLLVCARIPKQHRLSEAPVRRLEMSVANVAVRKQTTESDFQHELCLHRSSN